MTTTATTWLPPDLDAFDDEVTADGHLVRTPIGWGLLGEVTDDGAVVVFDDDLVERTYHRDQVLTVAEDRRRTEAVAAAGRRVEAEDRRALAACNDRTELRRLLTRRRQCRDLLGRPVDRSPDGNDAATAAYRAATGWEPPHITADQWVGHLREPRP